MHSGPLLRAVVAVLVAAFAGLGGCASGPEFEAPERDGEGRYVIQLTADNTFEPKYAKVPNGATVVWVVDGGAHDVSSADGEWSSADDRPRDANGYPAPLVAGETYERSFNEKGTVVIWCHLHHEQGMKMVLKVG